MRQKLLLIRLDKIGDLICTLPSDQIVDSDVYEVTWIIQKSLGQVVDLGVRQRRYYEIDKNNSKAAATQFRELLKEIKPDIAISFQAPWWVNFELFRAGVNIRSGVRSQWHSFLFLNRSLRQKRSLAIKHELEYNLDLVRETLRLQMSSEFIYFEIKKPRSQFILEKFGLQPNHYIVVHPGMMGSALNWPQSKYISYIKIQLSNQKKIVITGTKSDESYLTEIVKEFSNNSAVIFLQSKLNLEELVEVLAFSELVVAPSTGVAHLAASVGAQVKSIYSPIRVHHPQRWAPRGPHVKVFLPQVKCPATYHCLKEACLHYNCMNSVTI